MGPAGPCHIVGGGMARGLLRARRTDGEHAAATDLLVRPIPTGGSYDAPSALTCIAGGPVMEAAGTGVNECLRDLSTESFGAFATPAKPSAAEGTPNFGYLVFGGVQAMGRWRSPLTRRHSRNLSPNQRSELSDATIVPKGDVDTTRSEDELYTKCCVSYALRASM